MCHTFLSRYYGNKKKRKCCYVRVCVSEHGRAVVRVCLDLCDREHEV